MLNIIADDYCVSRMYFQFSVKYGYSFRVKAIHDYIYKLLYDYIYVSNNI